MAVVNGSSGNDTLTGTQFADSIFGFAGNDLLQGLGRNDTLNGGLGNDTLNGGAAVDSLTGGAGNDIYIVDNINDTINEAANAGIDTIRSSVTYTLGSNLENLILTGTGAINGIGNILNNTIFGNAANNTISGINGNDTIYGGDGNDTIYGEAETALFPINNSYAASDVLYGGDGNDLIYSDSKNFGAVVSQRDTVYGGNGNDTLVSSGFESDVLTGGAGNDTYIIGNGDRKQDTIVEAVNSGIDTVLISTNYTLGSNLENLTLTETGLFFEDYNGTGNNLNNTIIGNSGNNLLRGQAGSDRLVGQAGNDTFIGSSGSTQERDTLTGGAGEDTFILGNTSLALYDDRNTTIAGQGDYALITDFNTVEDVIKLNGKKTDYFLATSPNGLPTGTAIYRHKPGNEPDELIAIVQGSSGLNLNEKYFRFSSVEFDLASLNGTNGFVLKGINAGDRSGFSVSNAGDINGDGFDDLVVGAYGVSFTSKSYVVFGKAGQFGASFDLSNLNGNNGFTINETGSSVSSAGDINGDGFADLIVGGSGYPGSRCVVVFGKAGSFDANLNPANLNGSNGFEISKSFNYAYSAIGDVVGSAGDFNGDGFDDAITNEFVFNRVVPDFERGYVVFGTGNFSPRLNPDDLNGSNGFRRDGIIESASDINGDGFDDLLIRGDRYYGDPYNEPVSFKYFGYVVFGKASGFDTSNSITIPTGDNRVNSIRSAADVNGDGFEDIILGVANSSYVVFGKATGFGSEFDLSSLNGANGFVIQGAGTTVDSAGDVNGDGFDDIIIGDSSADPNGQQDAGESYIIFGKAGNFNANIDVYAIDSNEGLIINGIDARDLSGASVSGAGDINGDGFDDIMIGARDADPNSQESAGESYVIYGRDFTNKVTRQGTTGNDLLLGTNSDDILVGGLGNDTLRGGNGRDVLIGGAGSDTLIYGAIDRRFDAGSGSDTLTVEISNVNIDLTTTPNNLITGIEIVDLTGTGNNSLTLTRLDLFDLSETTNRLIVKGNVGDRITSTLQGWIDGGTATVGGVLYDRFTSGAATLLVDTDITQTIS